MPAVRRLLALHLLLVAVMVLDGADARAEPALRSVAEQRFQEGAVAFGQGDYATALDLFRKAYSLAPLPALLHNIGRCQDELGDLVGAIDTFDRLLAVEPHNQDVRNRLRELRRRVAAGEQALPSPSPLAVSSPAPASTTTPPVAPSPAVVIAASPAPAPRRPLYRRGWFWGTVVAAIVVGGVAAGVAVAATSSPALTFPPLDAR